MEFNFVAHTYLVFKDKNLLLLWKYFDKIRFSRFNKQKEFKRKKLSTILKVGH